MFQNRSTYVVFSPPPFPDTSTMGVSRGCLLCVKVKMFVFNLIFWVSCSGSVHLPSDKVV